jgi:hypothetical protein
MDSYSKEKKETINPVRLASKIPNLDHYLLSEDCIYILAVHMRNNFSFVPLIYVAVRTH